MPPKDPTKGNAVDNFRPISCLPLLWKLMTGILAESMYGFLESSNILPNEQKGCKRESRGSRGAKDQLLIDKMVLKDCKRRHTNVVMAWIDYRKAYDMVPHSWIIEFLEIFDIARNVEQFIRRSMAQWKTELTSCGERLGHVHIRRRIFQGDSLSALLFVLCLIPLSLALRKVKSAYEFLFFFFFYKSIKFYNTYYGLHYLQELLYNTTGTNTPGEQKAVSTPRELTKIKERKLLKLNQHY